MDAYWERMYTRSSDGAGVRCVSDFLFSPRKLHLSSALSCHGVNKDHACTYISRPSIFLSPSSSNRSMDGFIFPTKRVSRRKASKGSVQREVKRKPATWCPWICRSSWTPKIVGVQGWREVLLSNSVFICYHSN